MPNWKSAESYQRLLAAMVASQDLKLNFREIAKYYGEGTTYNSIEGRFRIIKEQAKVLKAESDGKRPASTASTTTPKKEKVLSGRVQKNSTPSKPSKNPSTTRNGGEGLGMFGGDGTDETPKGNPVTLIKEEFVSSGNSSYYSGEDAVSSVASMGMDAAWDDGFLGQQLI